MAIQELHTKIERLEFENQQLRLGKRPVIVDKMVKRKFEGDHG